MLKTACPMPHVRDSSVFSIQIPFSFQVLLLTMTRGVIILPGLLLMPHWDPKACLSSVCLAKATDVLQNIYQTVFAKEKAILFLPAHSRQALQQTLTQQEESL